MKPANDNKLSQSVSASFLWFNESQDFPEGIYTMENDLIHDL